MAIAIYAIIHHAKKTKPSTVTGTPVSHRLLSDKPYRRRRNISHQNRSAFDI
jgi:hypothetical protein